MYDVRTKTFSSSITNQGITHNLKTIDLSFYTGIMFSFYKAAVFYKNEEYNNFAHVAERYIESNSELIKKGKLNKRLKNSSDIFLYNNAILLEAYAQAFLSEANNKSLSKAMNLFYKIELFISKDSLQAISLNTIITIIHSYTVLIEASGNPHVYNGKKLLLHALSKCDSDLVFSQNCKVQLVFASCVLSNSIENSIGISLEIINNLLLKGLNSSNSFVYCNNYLKPNAKKYYVYWDVQLESMVALLNAYNFSKDSIYLNSAFNLWKELSAHFVDRKNGEWFYRLNQEKIPSLKDIKCGVIKSPYQITKILTQLIDKINHLHNEE